MNCFQINVGSLTQCCFCIVWCIRGAPFHVMYLRDFWGPSGCVQNRKGLKALQACRPFELGLLARVMRFLVLFLKANVLKIRWILETKTKERWHSLKATDLFFDLVYISLQPSPDWDSGTRYKTISLNLLISLVTVVEKKAHSNSKNFIVNCIWTFV